MARFPTRQRPNPVSFTVSRVHQTHFRRPRRSHGLVSCAASGKYFQGEATTSLFATRNRSSTVDRGVTADHVQSANGQPFSNMVPAAACTGCIQSIQAVDHDATNDGHGRSAAVHDGAAYWLPSKCLSIRPVGYAASDDGDAIPIDDEPLPSSQQLAVCATHAPGGSTDWSAIPATVPISDGAAPTDRVLGATNDRHESVPAEYPSPAGHGDARVSEWIPFRQCSAS